MESSSLTGRPQITIVNGTRCAVWVAIYKRSSLSTSEPPIAWQVVSPPPRGNTAVFIPRDYQVCARYSFEPENSRRPVYQTNVLQVPHAPAGAGFVLESVSSPDRRTWGAVLTRTAESPGWYQVRVVNHFSIGISSHIKQEGRDIFPPRTVPPKAAWIEEMDSSFYVAVLPFPRAAGDLLLNSEISLTETVVKAGESVKIQREPLKGFKISRIIPGTSSSALFEEPDLCEHEPAPSVPGKKPKPQAKPKADVRKREVAKSAVKKPEKKAAPRASPSVQRRSRQAQVAQERTRKPKSKAGDAVPTAP